MISRRHGKPRSHGRWLRAVLVALLAAAGASAIADDTAYVVLADFEDASVAARIGEVRNTIAGDCRLARVPIPARGQGSLALEIGVTAPGTSVVCDLTFRETTRLDHVEFVAVHGWHSAGDFSVGVRVRDARGQVFETPLQRLRDTRRWVRVTAKLDASSLTRVHGSGPLTAPIQVTGIRVATDLPGKQTLYLDDLTVACKAPPWGLVRGELRFDEPTRIYEPGTTVGAAVVIENQSRAQPLDVAVDLLWTHQDGTALARQQASMNLPRSGDDYRSHRRLDFSQRVPEPGLYRLVATARTPGARSPQVFESTIAVTPSNRRVSRGRSVFFAVRSNLLRESERDQLLEVSVARDLGVNLLAVDLPWAMIEPKRGKFDLAPLAPIVETVTADMALMFVITAPPAWLEGGARRIEPLAALIETMAQRFGRRIQYVQVGADVFAEAPLADALRWTDQVRGHFGERAAALVILPPPIRVDGATPIDDLRSYLQDHADAPLVFQTAGDTDACLLDLERLRDRLGRTWSAPHWWAHAAEPRTDAGHDHDAQVVLRHYVAAAAAGVAGLIWSDLRDDDTAAGAAESLRGMVRRDFSPKASVLGFAAAAGQLTGCRCSGPVPGVPRAYESALFIGGSRQIAVLVPRPNQPLPAVLEPVSDVQGSFSAQDFERRSLAVLASSAPPLVVTIPRPMFVTFTPSQPQPDPVLAFHPPWLRAPREVFIGVPFDVEMELVFPGLQHVQVRLPTEPPLEVDRRTLTFHGDPGEVRRASATISRAEDRAFDQAGVTLRVSAGGTQLEVPLDLYPCEPLRALEHASAPTDVRYAVGSLTPRAVRQGTATVEVRAAYEPRLLHLALIVRDDRIVGGDTHADRLHVGIVTPAMPAPVELAIDPSQATPALMPLSGTDASALDGWRCTHRTDDGRIVLVLEVPAAALGWDAVQPGAYIRAAVQYLDDDGDGFGAVSLTWGEGFDGGRSAARYRWLRVMERTDGDR